LRRRLERVALGDELGVGGDQVFCVRFCVRGVLPQMRQLLFGVEKASLKLFTNLDLRVIRDDALLLDVGRVPRVLRVLRVRCHRGRGACRGVVRSSGSDGFEVLRARFRVREVVRGVVQRLKQVAEHVLRQPQRRGGLRLADVVGMRRLEKPREAERLFPLQLRVRLVLQERGRPRRERRRHRQSPRG
jgi:hypothetical protein